MRVRVKVNFFKLKTFYQPLLKKCQADELKSSYSYELKSNDDNEFKIFRKPVILICQNPVISIDWTLGLGHLCAC